MANPLSQSSCVQFSFKAISQEDNSDGFRARLGHLEQNGRMPVSTPHYIGVTSRGVVPHLTPDMMLDNTSIKGVYTAFEDCKSAILFL